MRRKRKVTLEAVLQNKLKKDHIMDTTEDVYTMDKAKLIEFVMNIDGEQIDKAIIIATWAHRARNGSDGCDKSGVPYIFHPMRVALRLPIIDDQCIAIMHDVLEDTEITKMDLAFMGFNIYIIDGVVGVTRIIYDDGTKEPYNDFVRRACKLPQSRRVKRADIEDNTDPVRLSELTKSFQNKLKTKYAIAIEIINTYEVCINDLKNEIVEV